MSDPDVTMEGILGINNTAPPSESTGYYLDHVAIEVDMSEVKGLDPSLEGLPLNVEGHFEVREDENPDSPSAGSSRRTMCIRTWEAEAEACRPSRPRTSSSERPAEGAPHLKAPSRQ